MEETKVIYFSVNHIIIKHALLIILIKKLPMNET